MAGLICQLLEKIPDRPSRYEFHCSSQTIRSTNWNSLSYTQEIPPKESKIQLHYYWFASYMATILAYTEYRLKDTFIVTHNDPFARHSQCQLDNAVKKLRAGGRDTNFKAITKYPESKTIEEANFRNLNSLEESTQHDGPNTNNDVIVACSKKIPRWPFKELIFNLAHLNPENSQRSQLFAYTATLPGHHLITLALGRSALALVSSTYSKQILSVYEYEDPHHPTLKARTHLPGTLSKISFLTRNTLLGLTGDKRLITLWRSDNKIKYKAHKTPFAIQQFAIDPYTPDQLIFSYEEDGKFCIAASALKAIAQGKYLFKKVHSSKAHHCSHRLTYVEGYAACEFQGRREGQDWINPRPVGFRIYGESLPKKYLENELKHIEF